MGCGSTKLNSSAHAASSPDNAYEYNNLLMGREAGQGNGSTPPPCDVAIFPSNSSQGTLFSKGSPQSAFSTAMGIKGNSTIRVTLSDDGSLLEVETVTIDPLSALSDCEEDRGCNLTVAQIDSIPERSEDMDTYSITEGQCDSYNSKIPDNSRKSVLLSNAYNCLCSNETAIKGKTNSGVCSCIKDSTNTCQTASKLAHSSLPNIKSRCWEDSGTLTPSHTTSNHCPELRPDITAIPNSNSHSISGLIKQDAGGLSEHNCIQTERNHSTARIPRRNDRIKRSVSDCYYPPMGSPVCLRGSLDNKHIHDESSTDSFLPAINGSETTNHLPLVNSTGVSKPCSVVSDYTCLDYCARKCYKNPSLPRLSSKQLDNLPGYVSTPKSATIPSGLSSGGQTRGTNSASNNSISTSTHSSSIKNSNCSSSNSKYSRSNSSSAVSRGSTAKSSAKSTPSSAYKNEHLKNGSSEKSPLNLKLLSCDNSALTSISSAHENTFTSRSSSSPSRDNSHMSFAGSSASANLSKGRCKKYLSIFKTKALSEDTPSVLHQSHHLKPKHSASFDGPATLSDTPDEAFVEPVELNVCDINYVHQDFFNDFGDFYDEDDNT